MAGLSDALFQSLEWSLTSLDDGHVVKGQFLPTDLREDMGASYASVGTLGRRQPILQYDNETDHVMTFTAKVWAKHQGVAGLGQDEIEELVDAIKATVKPDPDLGRPHVFTFQAGESVALQACVVTGIGGISYDRMRPLDGSLRGVSFQMRLQEFVEYDTSLTGTGAESLVLALKENEGFEHIARRVYGDAEAGEALRRRNPDKVVPAVGDLVHLPPKSKLLLGFKQVPQNDVLDTTLTGVANARRGYFLRRARQFTLYKGA